jgi:hypothetical protein
LLTGTYDFFGLNFYTANLGRDGVEGEIPSRGRDIGAILSQDPNWPESASSWLRVRTSSHLLIYFFSLNLISFQYTTLSPSLFSISSYSVYLYTVPPNSIATDELIFPSISTKTASMSRIVKILLLRSYHEPDEFCQRAHALIS